MPRVINGALTKPAALLRTMAKQEVVWAYDFLTGITSSFKVTPPPNLFTSQSVN